MNRTLSYVIVLSCVTLFGCIAAIDLKLDGADRLVVDGMITDERGPYTVKLSRTLAFDNTGLISTYFRPESGAVVTIMSDANEEVLLNEISPGVYRTDTLAIRGQVGRSYWTRVKTTDVNTYTSIPEELLPTSAITEIIPKLVAIPRTSSSGNDVFTYRFDISIVTSDAPGIDNYYRWKSTGIIEYESTADNPVVHTCWVGYAPLEAKITLADDRLIDGSTFTQSVGTAPYERPSRFQAKVRQFSLTPHAYEFWKIILQQQEATGGIFDPPPAQVIGNIINESDPNDTPLGYFGASGVSEIALVFDRFKVANFFFPPDYIAPKDGDCRTHEPNATNVRPEGF
jgi:hypothetical protein